jgi:hypothetical protein
MLVGLFAPEVLLFLAINQRVNASVLANEAMKPLWSPSLPNLGVLIRAYYSVLRPKIVSTHTLSF